MNSEAHTTLNKNHSLIGNLSLLFIWLISAVFCFKYSGRLVNEQQIILTALFLLALVPLYFLIRFLQKKSVNVSKIQLAVFGLGFIFMSWFMLSIDLMALKVDRWSAVVYWWNAVFKGVYPYLTRTHLGGFHSPSPVLEAIYFPGYLIGEIGWVNIVAFALFLLYLYKKLNPYQYLLALLLFFSSIAIFWEVAVRSSLILNALFVFIVIQYLLNIRPYSTTKLILAGILTGLLLSTRMAVVLPLASVVIYIFVKELKFKGLVIYGLVSLIVFSLTFLPLIFAWGIDPFMSANPIMHQQKALPIYFTLICFALSLLFGFISKDETQLLFYIGFVFLLTGLIFEGYGIYAYGFECAFHGVCGDISYINLSLPFFFFNLKHIKFNSK